jgi:hypothetical protein
VFVPIKDYFVGSKGLKPVEDRHVSIVVGQGLAPRDPKYTYNYY